MGVLCIIRCLVAFVVPYVLDVSISKYVCTHAYAHTHARNCDNQKYLKHCKISPGGGDSKYTQVEKHCSRKCQKKTGNLRILHIEPSLSKKITMWLLTFAFTSRPLQQYNNDSGPSPSLENFLLSPLWPYLRASDTESQNPEPAVRIYWDIYI